MTDNRQKTKVIYVSKIGTEFNESIVLKCNFEGKLQRNGITIISPITKEDFVDEIKKLLISFFGRIAPSLEEMKGNTKFNVKFRFNQEHSGEGELLFDQSEDKVFLERVSWSEHKKLLSEQEIDLFFKALWEIPIARKE